MSIGNLIKKNDKFDREYIAEVISNNDPLQRGRLLVKIPSLMNDIAFWTNAALVTGSVNFLIIPDSGDKVNIKFRNKDIYSGEWELKGSPSNSNIIDPNKYGLSDANGNTVIIDKLTNTVTIKGASIIIDGVATVTGDLNVLGTVTANDAMISTGADLVRSQTVTSVKGIVKGA